MMAGLLIVPLVLVLVFLGCGLATTAGILFCMQFQKPKFLSATVFNAMSSIAVSCVVASLAIYAMLAAAEARTPAGEKFECCGMMQGGLFILIIWLFIYSVAYIPTSVIVGRYQRKQRQKALAA
ncbi:MAG: hypothetical protein ABIT83_13235 [Massilia sp.]